LIPSPSSGNSQKPVEGVNVLPVLESFINDGGYRPGDRLPSEREMIEALGVGRSALRRALVALQREGRIWRHVGKGTFLAEDFPESGQEATVARLGERLTPIKMMRARLCYEPALAREAAVNASRRATARIGRAEQRTRAASNWSSYESADDDFHRAVAEASDNLLLIALFDHLNQVRRAVAVGAVVRSTTRPPHDHPSFGEHESIADAIRARDPAAAQEAMRRHLGSVSARLFGEI